MDKVVAAVRAVNLSKFRATSWQQVLSDLDRHADELAAELGDDIDARPLSEILKLVLKPIPKPPTPEKIDIPKPNAAMGSWVDDNFESPPPTPANSEDEEDAEDEISNEEDAEDEIPNVSVGPSLSA